MRFSEQQIELAKGFKASGLPWEPSVGNYVYDSTGFLKPSSPFQDHVYFILNYDCFMDWVGGPEQFKELMTWLPTWDDARKILKEQCVPVARVESEIVRRNSLAAEDELTTLYELIEESLDQRRWNRLPVKSRPA